MWVDELVRSALLALIRAYRYFLSPFFGQHCRFHPTCSAYAIEAIESHGPWRGAWLAVRRVGRCHPLNDGGVDWVPPVGESGRTPPAGSAGEVEGIR